MLALAADGAVVLDPAGRIQSFNASAERLFGYREKDVVGESVLMLLAPPSHPAATAGLDSLSRLADGSSSEPPIAVVGRERDGAALALTLTLARVGPPDAPYYCALFRDMRREREAERRLIAARDAALAASAAKTDFLAHVSHEIRTPLHAILGFAEVMMEERFGPIGNDRYRDYLKDIHASGRHVMSLADDLLDLSKIESGKLELDFAPVDANSLIRECVSLMQPQAARERIIMRVSLFDRLPHVMVDERSLRQIMLNLMSNAVKFNEPGGQVIVSTAVDAAGQAVIRVRDTGVGMNESEVGVALEPFGQVGRGGRKGGVGLGLPLTKALVEANRAEFSIKSRRDQGTLIEICFPVVAGGAVGPRRGRRPRRLRSEPCRRAAVRSQLGYRGRAALRVRFRRHSCASFSPNLSVYRRVAATRQVPVAVESRRAIRTSRVGVQMLGFRSARARSSRPRSTMLLRN